MTFFYAVSGPTSYNVYLDSANGVLIGSVRRLYSPDGRGRGPSVWIAINNTKNSHSEHKSRELAACALAELFGRRSTPSLL